MQGQLALPKLIISVRAAMDYDGEPTKSGIMEVVLQKCRATDPHPKIGQAD